MSDLNLKKGIYEDISLIEKDIKNIEVLLKQVLEAMDCLDEKRWKSKEKNKIDQEFIPYLKKAYFNYPKELRSKLNHLKDAVNTYEETDILANKKIEEVSENITMNTTNSSLDMVEEL